MIKSLFSRHLVLAAYLLAIIIWPVREGAADTAIGRCDGGYTQCLADWKDQRLAFLRSDEGYLNLAGLFWLKEGQNTFGGSSSNDIVFPGIMKTKLGVFSLIDGQITMSVNAEYDVRVVGRKVGNIIMLDDTTTDPTVATHSSLSWSIIRRANQFAVRLRDFNHPALENFPPIDSFPADESYIVKAVLHRYPERRVIRVDTVIEGLDYNPWSPGVVRFEFNGETYELEAYDAGSELFIVFGDRTSGRETYPAGRFLYARKPGNDGEITLDFNTAHNPPCAFNEFATCPIASLRNRLPVDIPVGERFDPTAH